MQKAYSGKQEHLSFDNQASVGSQTGIANYHGPVHIHNTSLSARDQISKDKDDKGLLESLAFPEMFDRRNQIETAHPSTCRWILANEEYLSWQRGIRGLLWVKGKPGSGKSTLMSFLRDVMKRDEDVIYLNFFFSARGTDLQRTPMGMLRCLTSQLFTQSPAARSIIMPYYKENCGAYGTAGSGWNWQRAGLERLFSQSLLHCAEQRQVEVFVDALDETGREALNLARLFHTLTKSAFECSAKLRICISCRHYPIQTTISSNQIWVEKQNYLDIKLVVEEYLSFADEDDEWHALKEDIVSRAQGIFQWVHIALSVVEQAYQDGLSMTEIRQSLKQIPQELTEVYEYVIRKVIAEGHRQESFILFQWICLARRPLTVVEMYQVFRTGKPDTNTIPSEKDIESQMQRRVITLSGGLLEIVNVSRNNQGHEYPGDGQIIQVIHQSVNDYLMQGGLQLLNLLQTNHDTASPPTPVEDQEKVIFQSHSNIYWSCLRVILNQEKEMTEKFQHFDHLNNLHLASPVAKFLIENVPLLSYATEFLFHHASMAQMERARDLDQEIQLLIEVIPLWTKIYNFMEPFSLQTRPYYGTTILHLAVRYELLDIFDRVVSEKDKLDGVDCIAATDERGSSALHLAALTGRQLMVETLYKAGAPLDSRDSDQQTPLTIAVAEGHMTICKWFLDNGASLWPGTENETAISALEAAIESGNIPIFLMLIDNGADISQVDGPNGNALVVASISGNEYMVRAVLRAGAQVNQLGEQTGAALHEAARWAHLHIIPILLTAGADMNLISKSTGTPLQTAILNGHLSTVSLLLEYDIDVNLADLDGITALEDAVCCSNELRRRRMVALLIETGADVNKLGSSQESILNWAIKSASREDILVPTVSLLLEAGANPNLIGEQFGTALQIAAAHGFPVVTAKLIEAGADVNLMGGVFDDALQEASKRGYKYIENLLLKAGAIQRDHAAMPRHITDYDTQDEDDSDLQIPSSFE